MDAPATDIPRTLQAACLTESMEWLHDRTNIHVPVGQAGFNMAIQAVGSGHVEMTDLMLVHQCGMQPLVLRNPPLYALLMEGPGHAKTTACAVRPKHYTAGWISAHQLIMFYVAIMCTNAIGTAKKSGQRRLFMKSVDTLTAVAQKWQNDALNSQMTQLAGSSEQLVWSNLMKTMDNAEASDDERVRALCALGVEFGTQPQYTLSVIHEAEIMVWSAIMLRCPSLKEVDTTSDDAELQKKRVFETVPLHLVLCPPECVMPMAQWKHDSEICAEIADEINMQSNCLRKIMCGDHAGTVMRQWPSIRLPDPAVVSRVCASASVEESYVPLESSVYTALSFFNANILATRKPEVDAPPPIKPLPPIEQLLAAGKKGDVPHIVAKNDS